MIGSEIIMNIALLTAGGIGSRMHQEIPKQFLHVNNKPIIIYTLEAFQKNPSIDFIIVAVLEKWGDILWAYARQYNITKLKWVVTGGQTGQESIYNCLQKLLLEKVPMETIITIHDGNRPLVTQDIIADSIATYKKYGSAVAAIPCVEAIFKSDNKKYSEISIPRDELYRTQTPHTYSFDKLLWAHKVALEKRIENTAATCVLMNILGEKVYFSLGSVKNLKITTMDDLDIFKALVKEEIYENIF